MYRDCFCHLWHHNISVYVAARRMVIALRHDIRMLVTDLDGTLISDDESISEANLRALHTVRELGLYIALCSGRDPKGVSDIALAAGLDDCVIIALNGAVVLDAPNGEILEEHALPPASAMTCLDILLAQAGELVSYAGDSVTTLSLSTKSRQPRSAAQLAVPSDAEVKRSLYTSASFGINKLLYREMDHPDRLRPIRKKLSTVQGVDITSSWFTNIEVMPSGINKGYAVRRLADRLDVNLDQIIAFGDNDNDAGILAQVGYGIAMGNASDAARSAARYTTDTSIRNGVAKGVERFILSMERPSA